MKAKRQSPNQALRRLGAAEQHLSKGQAAIPSGQAALDQLRRSQGYQQRHSAH
jgi:hypothetical protein